MPDVIREIERKYDAAADTGLPDLRALPGVHTAAPTGPRTLSAVYWDTTDLRLAAEGITLRRRTGGSDEGWHLKLPVATPQSTPGTTVRDEHHHPLGEEPAAPPEPLAALVRSRTRHRPLLPRLRLVQERTALTLLDADGRPLAEVGLDRVHAVRLPDDGTGTPSDWTELEAELGEFGDPALLDAVDGALLAAGAHRSAARSKLHRALAETGTPASEPAAPPHPRTAGDVALRYVRRQVEALVRLDPQVRCDVHDSVHRMRVATRRLRSCFRTCDRLLDRAATDPLRDELKWLAAELGADRDREVLTARLADGLSALPPRQLLGPVAERLDAFSAHRRSGSRARLGDVLDSDRYLGLLESLAALLDRPPLLKRAARAPERPFRRALARDFDRVAARVGEALAADEGDERDRALHDARKAAKRLRYAAEAARPVLGAPAKEYTALVAELQQLLGDHQDSLLAREALLELAAEAAASGEPSFTYGVLHERERELARGYGAGLPEAWRAVAPGGRCPLV